jgi:predicted nucleotidyltransferase
MTTIILQTKINPLLKWLQHIQVRTETKHIQILKDLLKEVKNDENILGYLVFGSVASGTYTKESDLDVITIFRNHRPSYGINKMIVDDIIVDSLFITFEVLTKSVHIVPYLLHPLGHAQLLFDRQHTIQPLLAQINDYFAEHPKIEREWNTYIHQSSAVKLTTGCRASAHGNTIIDVWNHLERRYSNGTIKRPFFNAFYLTNSPIFSLVKRFLKLTERR